MEIDLRFKEGELTEDNKKALKDFDEGIINFSEFLNKLNVEEYNIKITNHIMTVFGKRKGMDVTDY